MMEQKYSPSEQHLLNYINLHQQDMHDMSIVKLSEETNVSTATIVRTMKKMGFDGFTSFKYSLKETNPGTIKAMEKVDKEIKGAILKNEQEVTKTIESLNIGAIEDTIQKMKAAKRIFIFARGFSELIAKEMTLKLQLVNKYCEMHDDPNIIRTISKKIKKEDLVIFISLNSETIELIEACKSCQKNDVTTINITANAQGALHDLADINFVGFKSPISYFPDYEVRSRLPLQVISRIILDAYSLRQS
ncbi:MAG: MurR/RpiR family transcriptional regulator [Vagococcus fluvialis]|uniref:MurR/RpiR family transcriptional regulator n=1 Tax=Vagococcus fluvialis TaxID=2738 RepID=UPI002D80D3D9|nr:MurR/RpiR family transcriptional regulator [Vagococcus fluvialis]